MQETTHEVSHSFLPAESGSPVCILLWLHLRGYGRGSGRQGHVGASPGGRKGHGKQRAVRTLAWEEEEVETMWEPDRRGLPSHAKKLGLYFL